MENKDLQIIAEMSDMVASLRRQIEELDEMIGRYRKAHEESADYQYDMDDMPIDIDIDDLPGEEPMKAVEDAVDEAAEDAVDEAAEVVDVKDPVEDVIEEPAIEAEADSVFEPVVETVAEPVVEAAAETAPVRQAVIDVLEDRQAWRTDMPGAPVRDIRSAISLNDRVLFINRLFNEDPISFQDMLSKINNMTSLDEVVEAVVTEHPEWDLGAEVVYRFMMAVRRKVR